jgi:hypothetical protein
MPPPAPAAGSVGTADGLEAGAETSTPGGSTGLTAKPSAELNGPGVTDTTITFGVTYATDTAQANAAAGASDVDGGDIRRYYDAMVDEVNRTGGVAGRKLVANYYETSTTSSETADNQRLAACEHWVNDVKAFAWLDATSEAARACAEQHGLLSLSGGGNAVKRTFVRYPHYLEPAGIALETYEGGTVSGLAKTDYYGTAPVIGIVTWDDPSFRTAVEHGMVPELTKLGLKAKVISYVDVAQAYSGVGSTSASISNAILRFRREGVTHVFVADGPSGVCLGACLTVLWLRGAASQRYYPRYGLNDLNSPQAGIDAKLWGPDDLRGSRAFTVGDFDDASDAGVTKNPSRLRCLAIMKRHGMVPGGNLSVQGAMLQACGNVSFLRAVLGTARGPVNRDRFVALAEGLGSTFRAPQTYRTELGPGRHYGAAGFRRMALDDACGCFVYLSGVYAL